MKFSVLQSTCCVILFLSGCTWQRADNAVKNENPISAPAVPASKPLFSKELREGLHFAASLERESLRLISKNNSFEGTTLFSTLSYAFEIASGIKRSAPRNVDCSRFQITPGAAGILKIFKVCQKPMTLIATVTEKKPGSSNETELEVLFHIKEWASVVGMSVTLTNSDIACRIQIKEKKLQQLTCDNWAYLLSSSDASATEVHLKMFSFRRDESLQLKLQGGFYRDLIERKKIEVKVPLQGKIELIEKEIDVKDDFAEKPQPPEDKRGEKDEKKDDKKDDEYKNFIKTEEPSSEPKTEIQTPGQPQVVPENNLENVDFGPEKPAPENEIEQGESSGGVPKPNPRGTRGR